MIGVGMSHAEWRECVEKACGIVEMTASETRGLWLCRKMLASQAVSVVVRTVGYGAWKLAGGT